MELDWTRTCQELCCISYSISTSVSGTQNYLNIPFFNLFFIIYCDMFTFKAKTTRYKITTKEYFVEGKCSVCAWWVAYT